MKYVRSMTDIFYILRIDIINHFLYWFTKKIPLFILLNLFYKFYLFYLLQDLSNEVIKEEKIFKENEPCKLWQWLWVKSVKQINFSLSKDLSV